MSFPGSGTQKEEEAGKCRFLQPGWGVPGRTLTARTGVWKAGPRGAAGGRRGQRRDPAQPFHTSDLEPVLTVREPRFLHLNKGR